MREPCRRVLDPSAVAETLGDLVTVRLGPVSNQTYADQEHADEDRP
jgi:hypothetical protein